MRTFLHSLLLALKITLVIVLVISLVGIGVLGWYFYDTTFADTPSDNALFQFIESLVPQRESQTPQLMLPTEAPTTEPTTEPPTEPPTTEPPVPEHVVTTATIGTVGDLLMHKPVFDTCRQSDGSYNFESIFRYIAGDISSLDYAIANLETTFGGDNYKYQGNPAFNCPDALAYSVADAGFDMLLTANNHSGDTMGPGIIRTIEHVRGSGLATLGSQLSGEPRYSIVDVNGIKIGMVCYTWSYSGDGINFSLNGLQPVKDEGQMNYFTNKNPDKLYNEAQQIITEMKNQGAEATMMFIHWGVEYVMVENALQDTIAQRLCDMGFDVIVGGHPHVVQPMDLLTSTVDPDHKTVVIYSLGNAVSNQRTGISDLFPAGYTEDGVLFNVTFCKYSDGTVYLQDVDVIPTWVDLRTTNGRYYFILPLDGSKMDQWQSQLDLSDVGLGAATRSYNRTMGIVGEGLNLAKQYLADAQELRDANYLAALYDAIYAA